MSSLFSIPKPDSESKASVVSTVGMLKQDLCTYEQRLVNVISFANEERNSSDLDVLMSLSEGLEVAVSEFLDTSHSLIATRKWVVHVCAEESVESIYHYLKQKQCDAVKL